MEKSCSKPPSQEAEGLLARSVRYAGPKPGPPAYRVQTETRLRLESGLVAAWVGRTDFHRPEALSPCMDRGSLPGQGQQWLSSRGWCLDTCTVSAESWMARVPYGGA